MRRRGGGHWRSYALGVVGGLALVLVEPMWKAPLVAQSEADTRLAAPTPAAMREHIGTLRGGGVVRFGDAAISPSRTLTDFYARRDYAEAWADPAAVAELERAVRAVYLEGLTPEDYHARSLGGGWAARTPGGAAALDILRTDALLRLAHDLRYGKVDPNDPAKARDLSRPLGGTDPVADLTRMISAPRLATQLEALRPTHHVYRGLVGALAEYRRLENLGAWAAIPAGTALKLGSVGPRVPALRQRLTVLGHFPPAAGGVAPGREDRFDDALLAAVTSFQERHGLNQDGVVGPYTLAELNTPITQRIEQIRVNLDRARALARDLPATYVLVNAAAARVYLVKGGASVWESRVIVGKEQTRTPMFRAPMRYIELNPTWTVPPGIVGEVIADVRSDPSYLGRNSFRILDSAGRQVPMSAAEVVRYTAKSFPYTFRQDAGPLNPLGRIKFMFPNRYNVYLHDTPARQLFDQEQRTFSHGCIRVQDPLALAVAILDDPARWSREALEAAIATGRTRQITLAQPVTVLIEYWTATADPAGRAYFYRDVYGRDAAVVRALSK